MTNETYTVSPYKDVPITVSADGLFCATVDGVSVTRDSRREIVEAINDAEKRRASDKREEVGLALLVLVDGKVKDATFVGVRSRGTAAYPAGSYVVRVEDKLVPLAHYGTDHAGRETARLIRLGTTPEQHAEIAASLAAVAAVRERLSAAFRDTVLDLGGLPYVSRDADLAQVRAAEQALCALVIDSEVSARGTRE